jgi:Lrp/AsnC family transcriptional regulator, regulator for asnA, asnC and gidA
VLRTDDVDESILGLLRDDGRLSNREVARRLDISEGTVRQRLKKLEDARAIRIGAVVDPIPLGIGVGATVMVTIDPANLSKALDAFSTLPGVAYVAAITGRFNVFASITAANNSELRAVVGHCIERFTGVHAVEIRPMLRIPKHEYHVIAIPRS